MFELIRPPEGDEIEFSAFGPGYGECLLVHLGEGQWMIVDSCKHSKLIPVLDYLDRMKVDLATDVELVVTTHWHDDHIRGLSEVLDRCKAAKFACSGALSGDELLQAIGRMAPQRGGSLTSGVKEMRTVLELLADGESKRHAQWATARQLLFRRRNGTIASEVLALAPSDEVLLEGYRHVVDLVKQGQTARVPKPDRNIGAIVLWVEVGDATMLLGSDLQETPGQGWTAVLDCCDGIGRRSEIFKVPHHGSVNAHHDPVWEQILVNRPEAVICPHRKGDNSLPTEADVRRLCKLANVHLTAPAGVRTTIQKGRRMRPANGAFGRVTLRRRVGDTMWSAEYAGEATECCSHLAVP